MSTGNVSRLILLRHGRTEWNATARFQGQADIPLDELGREQARLAGEALATTSIDEFWSSDLSRAHDTARAVAEPRGMTVRADPAFREIHVGSWEGLTAAEVSRIDPEFGVRYARGEDVRRSETGETTTEVGDRVAAKLRELVEVSEAATVLVGIHGLAAMSGALTFLEFPRASWLSFAPLINCHWIDLRRGPGGDWRIHGWNVGPDGLVDGEQQVRSAEQGLRSMTSGA